MGLQHQFAAAQCTEWVVLKIVLVCFCEKKAFSNLKNGS